MEEIRRAAAAYYQNLPLVNKRYVRYNFNSMDKNGDGQINLDEYVEYLNKDNKTVLTHPSMFRALDKNNNGSLDFDEVIVLYYITQSGRALFCKSCNTFLTDLYFSCSQCFFKGDSVSTYEICCDCYGGRKFTHHGDAIFCDNYAMLSRSRRLALQASKEEQNSVVEEIDMATRAANVMNYALQASKEEQNSVVEETDVTAIAANVMNDALQASKERRSAVGEIDFKMIASIANLMSDAQEYFAEGGSSVFEQIDFDMISSVANLAVSAGCIIM